MPHKPKTQLNALSDQAIDWVLRLKSGQATGADRQQAEEWRNRSPAHQNAYLEAEQLWQDMGLALQAKQNRQNPQQSAITSSPPNRLSQWHYGLTAAMLLLAVALPFSQYPDRWLSDYSTTIGEQKNITLADGSRILLNTGTAIDIDFQPNGRRITLRHGQALFTVAADPKRPFEVATETALTKALGTVFEVKDEGQDTRVTVQEHAVGVKGINDKDYAPAARIEAGQQAVYNAGQGLGAITPVDITQNSAWQRGKLIFKNQPFQTVVAELDRYYPGRLLIVNNKLATLRVTGVFPANDTTATLGMIEHILPVKVTRVMPWLTLLHG